MTEDTKGRGNKIRAALRLVKLLKGGKWVAITTIQKELKVGRRTARRWIQAADDIGMPIVYLRNPKLMVRLKDDKKT